MPPPPPHLPPLYVYLVPAVSNCQTVRDLIVRSSVPYHFIDLSLSPERRREIVERSPKYSLDPLPQIYIGEHYRVGGYHDFMQSYEMYDGDIDLWYRDTVKKAGLDVVESIMVEEQENTSGGIDTGGLVSNVSGGLSLSPSPHGEKSSGALRKNHLGMGFRTLSFNRVPKSPQLEKKDAKTSKDALDTGKFSNQSLSKESSVEFTKSTDDRSCKSSKNLKLKANRQSLELTKSPENRSSRSSKNLKPKITGNSRSLLIRSFSKQDAVGVISNEKHEQTEQTRKEKFVKNISKMFLKKGSSKSSITSSEKAEQLVPHDSDSVNGSPFIKKLQLADPDSKKEYSRIMKESAQVYLGNLDISKKISHRPQYSSNNISTLLREADDDFLSGLAYEEVDETPLDEPAYKPNYLAKKHFSASALPNKVHHPPGSQTINKLKGASHAAALASEDPPRSGESSSMTLDRYNSSDTNLSPSKHSPAPYINNSNNNSNSSIPEAKSTPADREVRFSKASRMTSLGTTYSVDNTDDELTEEQRRKQLGSRNGSRNGSIIFKPLVLNNTTTAEGNAETNAADREVVRSQTTSRMANLQQSSVDTIDEELTEEQRRKRLGSRNGSRNGSVIFKPLVL